MQVVSFCRLALLANSAMDVSIADAAAFVPIHEVNGSSAFPAQGCANHYFYSYRAFCVVVVDFVLFLLDPIFISRRPNILFQWWCISIGDPTQAPRPCSMASDSARYGMVLMVIRQGCRHAVATRDSVNRAGHTAYITVRPCIAHAVFAPTQALFPTACGRVQYWWRRHPRFHDTHHCLSDTASLCSSGLAAVALAL